MRTLVLIVHNIRSIHNVGSLLRTADGLGVNKLYLTGYTPYPTATDDSRMPHLRNKIAKQIHKTALGAEDSLDWEHNPNINEVLTELRQQGYNITALEQASGSKKLTEFLPPDKLALIVGREVEGLESEVLNQADVVLEIPMFGKKESFNVVQAAAIALAHCRFA